MWISLGIPLIGMFFSSTFQDFTGEYYILFSGLYRFVFQRRFVCGYDKFKRRFR